jgi:hypothetical protein
LRCLTSFAISIREVLFAVSGAFRNNIIYCMKGVDGGYEPVEMATVVQKHGLCHLDVDNLV